MGRIRSKDRLGKFFNENYQRIGGGRPSHVRLVRGEEPRTIHSFDAKKHLEHLVLAWVEYEWPVAMHCPHGQGIWKIAGDGFGDSWFPVRLCSYTLGAHMRGKVYHKYLVDIEIDHHHCTAPGTHRTFNGVTCDVRTPEEIIQTIRRVCEPVQDNPHRNRTPR